MHVESYGQSSYASAAPPGTWGTCRSRSLNAKQSRVASLSIRGHSRSRHKHWASVDFPVPGWPFMRTRTCSLRPEDGAAITSSVMLPPSSWSGKRRDRLPTRATTARRVQQNGMLYDRVRRRLGGRGSLPNVDGCSCPRQGGLLRFSSLSPWARRCHG